MSDEVSLRDKLRKIEALFAGAGTQGERAAAGAAAERIRARLSEAGRIETPIEMRLSVPDPWSQRLLVALCRRYGLRPYRYPRMKRQTIIVKAPRSFIEGVLWPEFEQINAALAEYLLAVTERVIREEVFREAGDAEEVSEPPRIS
jgi:hypothetical protein